MAWPPTTHAHVQDEVGLLKQGVRPVTTVTGSTTLALTHAGGVVEVNATGTSTITIPANASVAFPVGASVRLVQYGAGAVNVAAAAGVTVRSFGGDLGLAGQYAEALLIKRGTDEWMLTGQLAPATSGGAGYAPRPAATKTVNPTTDVQTLFNGFVAGDVVYLNGGTYGAKGNRWRVTTNGLVGSRIQVYAAPGATVTILGMFEMQGDYWTIGDVTFAGPTGYVVSSNNAGLGVDNQEGESDQFYANGAVGLTLDHCTIRDNWWNAGFYAANACADLTLENCWFYNNGPWHDPYQQHNSGGAANNLSHGAYLDGLNGGIVRNCLFEHNLAYGLQLYSSPSNVKVYNNTFVSNGYPSPSNSLYGGGIIAATSGTGNYIWNNLFYDNGRAVHTLSQTGSCTYEYNQTWAQRIATFTANTGHTFANNTSADPLFISSADFHLGVGSGAINAGVATYQSVAAPTTDRDNLPRTGLPDVGCYERQ